MRDIEHRADEDACGLSKSSPAELAAQLGLIDWADATPASTGASEATSRHVTSMAGTPNDSPAEGHSDHLRQRLRLRRLIEEAQASGPAAPIDAQDEATLLAIPRGDFA
jgi:hypothetical protein